MKEKNEYRYEFVNGDIVELRISRSGSVGDDKNGITSEWLETLLDLDRREYNNEHAETRRHVSLNALDRDDNQIPTEKDIFEYFYEEETWKEMCKELSEREKLIGDLYFRNGYTQPEIAKIFGINRPRVTQIITKIRKKLKKFL
nr:sigma-70 family RNA polymerase sigma factor [uncultured Blautia sp.]